MELFITRYMKLQDHRVLLNGIVEYASEVGSVGELFRSVYLHYNIDYPKFFKMDNLCKLAFLSAEILLQGTDILQKYPGEQIGIILENASSSLEYDRKHHGIHPRPEPILPEPIRVRLYHSKYHGCRDRYTA